MRPCSQATPVKCWGDREGQRQAICDGCGAQRFAATWASSYTVLLLPHSVLRYQTSSSSFGWVRFPWRRKWQPTPVFLPIESHGQRSLVGYSPQGRRVRHDLATKQLPLLLLYPLETFCSVHFSVSNSALTSVS